MGFFKHMLGNLMGGHHGSYRGGHHGGHGYGGYPGYQQGGGPGGGNPCPPMRQRQHGRSALLPAVRRVPATRQMRRLRRGTRGGRQVLRPVRQA